MENLKEIIYSLHPLERAVFPFLLNSNSILEISNLSNLSEAEVITGIQLLEQKGYSIYEKTENHFIVLDKFGIRYVDVDLPEVKFLKQIIDSSKKQSQLNLEKDEIGSALGFLKRNNLVSIEKKDELIYSVTEKSKSWLNENLENPLVLFKNGVLKSDLTDFDLTILNSFKLRKGFLKEIVKKSFLVSLNTIGLKIAKEIEKNYKNLDLLESLDPASLKSGSWKGKEFRHYDLNVKTSFSNFGRAHPMMESVQILSDVFLEMGFTQMEGPIIESAFWNMDVMWIPQDHPARDEQDTFYLDGKIEVPKKYYEKVKLMHESGIKKTHTEKGDFKKQISEKQLLRTHSTSTSFRYLAELGEKLKNGDDINGKYFYLANVFRNEAVDATHLAEFYQGEGFIIGDDLSLADLMGFIKTYYSKLGIEDIRFKPTFNPYTEPSMEAHFYDKNLKKWYALINSGIFRSETLKPFGLENKTVIAWGIGASRVAALLSKQNSMRDITGITCDFEFLKNRPIMNRKID